MLDQVITDRSEANAFACRTWGKAVGAESRTSGPIGGPNKGVNMSSNTYSPGGQGGFQDEHSAEFNRDIQKLQAFYIELLIKLKIQQNP